MKWSFCPDNGSKRPRSGHYLDKNSFTHPGRKRHRIKGVCLRMITVCAPARDLFPAMVTLCQERFTAKKRRAYDQFALPSDVAAQQLGKPGMAEAMIEFQSVTKQYQSGQPAVDQLSMSIDRGSITVFVGPSGCGKT